MIEVRFYTDRQGNSPLMQWLNDAKEARVRALVSARLERLRGGNFGDCKPLREGVLELRIDYGPGYRVYLSRQGQLLVLLLCASDKSEQSRAINEAVKYLNDWKERGKP